MISIFSSVQVLIKAFQDNFPSPLITNTFHTFEAHDGF